jgi:hypothetical protein
MSKRLLVLSLAIAFLAGCGGVKQEIIKKDDVKPDKEQFVEVEAEGVVAPVPGNILATKDQGLMAAQRNAIEKAVGVYITGQQIVSQAVMIEENIFSRTAGYIKEYKILSEAQDGEFFKTKIYAKVKLGDVKKDLDALGLLIRTKKVGNPRVMVIIDEETDGKPSSEKTAETIIVQQLLAAGYRVVDKDQMEKIKEEDKLKAAALGDEKAAALIAKKFDADIAVAGKAKSSVRKSDIISGAYTAGAVLNTKVIKVTSGDLLFAVNKTGSLWDLTPEMAVSKAVTKAATDASGEFVKNIAEKLFDSAIGKINLTGINSINKLNNFLKMVKGYDGVSSVAARSFIDDTAEIEIELKYGNMQTIAAKLETNKEFPLTVKEAGGHSVTVEIKK